MTESRRDTKKEYRVYDHALARKKLSYLTTDPRTGQIVDVAKIVHDNPEAIPEIMELVFPMLNYIGPAVRMLPSSGYLQLGTYCTILDVRRECRPALQGMALGDRTFKRCYQNALRDLNRYRMASDSLQKEAHKAGYVGVNIVFDGTEAHNGGSYPRIRRANANERADAVLRAPRFAAMKAFDIFNDKPWHHWLFPFGCFFYENMPTSDGWKTWSDFMLQGRNTNYLISPYSVTSLDVKFLLMCPGYVERFEYLVSIIVFLKKEMNYNILQCHRLPSCVPSDATFRRFLTLERYFYLFGSIWMHFGESKSNVVETGCPAAHRKEFSRLWIMVCAAFTEEPNTDILEYAVVRSVRSTQMLSSIFPKAEVMTPEKMS